MPSTIARSILRLDCSKDLRHQSYPLPYMARQSRFASHPTTSEYHRHLEIARRRLFRLRWNMETDALNLGDVGRIVIHPLSTRCL
jgi:hypothetical protein